MMITVMTFFIIAQHYPAAASSSASLSVEDPIALADYM